MRTVVGVNDPKAVKKYSAFCAMDTARKSYWTKRFMGVGEDSSMPLQMLKELEAAEGEYISFDLLMQMRMQPVEGDEVLENKEEDMNFYTDGVYIDQMRGGVNTGGRMSRKRTIHKLRKKARRIQTDWWARVFDEIFFMYASGARGVNADFVFPTTYAGFAGNALSAPDTEHIHYAGGKAKATLTATDVATVDEINKSVAVAGMMGGGAGGGEAGTDGNTQTPKIQPISVDGEFHFVYLMNPNDTYNLRADTGTGGWLDVQKAAAGAVGRKSPIFLGTLGMINNVVLHEHQACIRFSDYGAGSDVLACRNLFMGEQSVVVAFGSPGQRLRFGWNEETRDNGNQVVITTNTIFGAKKVTFNGKDYGMKVVDVASDAP